MSDMIVIFTRKVERWRLWIHVTDMSDAGDRRRKGMWLRRKGKRRSASTGAYDPCVRGDDDLKIKIVHVRQQIRS